MLGVVAVSQDVPIGHGIDELELLALVADPPELEGQVLFIT